MSEDLSKTLDAKLREMAMKAARGTVAGVGVTPVSVSGVSAQDVQEILAELVAVMDTKMTWRAVRLPSKFNGLEAFDGSAPKVSVLITRAKIVEEDGKLCCSGVGMVQGKSLHFIALPREIAEFAFHKAQATRN